MAASARSAHLEGDVREEAEVAFGEGLRQAGGEVLGPEADAGGGKSQSALSLRRKVGTIVSAASWKRSEQALRCCSKVLSQIRCRMGGIPERFRFSSGASEVRASRRSPAVRMRLVT
ncbi:hypothetical protein [Streptomyces sp. NPDC002602]|uniref:hypothetical protein n=1 Tax=Streptomyces sp. NPDC002602 TaxID=3364654 RepID=UPI0036BB7361